MTAPADLSNELPGQHGLEINVEDKLDTIVRTPRHRFDDFTSLYQGLDACRHHEIVDDVGLLASTRATRV